MLGKAGAYVLDSFAATTDVQWHHPLSPGCAASVRGYAVIRDGRRRWRNITFGYDCADPWVVWIKIGLFAGGGANCLVERDRLAAALRRAERGRPLVVPVLVRSGAPRHLVLLPPSGDRLAEFLDRTHDLVPAGSESYALTLWIDQYTPHLGGAN